MRGVTVVFGNKFDRLLGVLQRSWNSNTDIPLQVVRARPPDNDPFDNYGHVANTLKLMLWRENFNQDTIFIDADMLVLGDMAKGFKSVRDFARIKRSASSAAHNAGVVFARHTGVAGALFDEWVSINHEMYCDPGYYNEYAGQLGINQASLQVLTERHGDKIDTLPESYNLCPPFVHYEKARAIHIKDELREYILSGRRDNPDYEPIKQLWQKHSR